jgi:predicted PurR-regulated permease PerM
MHTPATPGATPTPHPDPVRLPLALAILGGLSVISIWILLPFLPALIWATMIVVATWPMMRGLEAQLGRRRVLATSIMTGALLLAFVIPLTLAVVTLVTHMDVITGWAKAIQEHAHDEPPGWVAGLPVVGQRISDAWREFVTSGEFGAKVTTYAGAVGAWFVAEVGDLGQVLLQFLLTVAISAILYARGEIAAAGVIRFARTIAGERGEKSVVLASQAIRGVALGVVVTALVQSAIGGIGLWVGGVPFAALLTAVMFMLSLAQIGAVPVMGGAAIWAFTQGQTGWGIFLVVWTLLVGGLDNVLRPILIRRGVDLPLLLILVGVIGGLVAFGLIGIFIGPAVLAVTYRLLENWIAAGEPAQASTRLVGPSA